MIFKLCGLRNLPYTYEHITPISVGRKSVSLFPKVRRWRMGRQLEEHLKKYGYTGSEDNRLKWIIRFIGMLPGNVDRLLSSFTSARKVRRAIKKPK